MRPLIERSRSLGDLASLLSLESVGDYSEVKFSGLTADSVAIQPGDLFIALPGAHRHGAEFIDQAIASGAVAVLTDSTGATLNAGRLPEVIASSPRSQLGEIASWFYDKPSAAMTAVGASDAGRGSGSPHHRNRRAPAGHGRTRTHARPSSRTHGTAPMCPCSRYRSPPE